MNKKELVAAVAAKTELTQASVEKALKALVEVTVAEVAYNGTGKFPGHFKKSLTVRTNGKVEMMRLYIEGDMTGK